jgi:microsomal dipeptidase-like Zn-dependent dipeptidase
MSVAVEDGFYQSLKVFDALQYSNWFGSPQNDAVSYRVDRTLLQQWRDGGLAGVHVTVTLWDDARTCVDRVTRWYRAFQESADLIQICLAGADLERAKRASRTAVLLGFQNTSPFEDDIGLVEVFYRLGIRVAQLTYNIQNFVGSSCYEIVDGGLTRFGRAVVNEMNRLGMLIDLSHVGEKTSLDAIEHSSRPVAVTHANPLSFARHPRNKSETLLRAVARSGGVVGCSPYPPLMGRLDVTLEEWCQMVADLAAVIGAEHVGIGTDTSLGWTDADLLAMNVARWSRSENWGSNLPGQTGWCEPVAWYRSSNDFPTLCRGLRKVGLDEKEVAGILGHNWQRLLTTILG